jgi:hypothetical protein
VTTIVTGEPYESSAQKYDASGVNLWTDGDCISIDLDRSRFDELRTLLSRGLNTWERAPEWLLKLAEIADKQ